MSLNVCIATCAILCAGVCITPFYEILSNYCHCDYYVMHRVQRCCTRSFRLNVFVYSAAIQRCFQLYFMLTVYHVNHLLVFTSFNLDVQLCTVNLPLHHAIPSYTCVFIA